MEKKEINKYDEITQTVKAFFFDSIYREQGLMNIFTNNSFNPAVKETISPLFTRQKETIEKVLGLLAEIGDSMKMLEATGKEIEALGDERMYVFTSEASENKSEEVVADVEVDNKQTGEVNDLTGEASGATVVPDAVSLEQGVVTGSEVVTNPMDKMDLVGDIKQGEQAQVALNGGFIANDMPIEKSTEPQDIVISPQAEKVAEPVINNANENDSEIDNKEVSGGFVLSPIDADVVPATVEEEKNVSINDAIASTERQLQAVEAVKDEITTDNNLTPEQKEEALRKYTRLTQNAVKAILVTKEQFQKLALSRTTQEALQNANQNNGIPAIVDNTEAVVSGEQGQDKQKELESMMTQANLLYKEGKTQEAQEIYNKISSINKEMQTEAAAGAAYIKK